MIKGFFIGLIVGVIVGIITPKVIAKQKHITKLASV